MRLHTVDEGLLGSRDNEINLFTGGSVGCPLAALNNTDLVLYSESDQLVEVLGGDGDIGGLGRSAGPAIACSGRALVLHPPARPINIKAHLER